MEKRTDDEHEGYQRRHEIPDPEDVKKILAAVRNEIPGMLRDIVDVLYNEKSAQSMGKAVGTYYKTLLQSGIPEEAALEMTKGYVINISKMFEKKHWGGHPHE